MGENANENCFSRAVEGPCPRYGWVQSGAISGRLEPVRRRGLIEFEASKPRRSKSQLSKTIPRWLSYTLCNRSTPSWDRVTGIVSLSYQSANHRVLSFYSPPLLRPCPQKFHSRNSIFRVELSSEQSFHSRILLGETRSSLENFTHQPDWWNQVHQEGMFLIWKEKSHFQRVYYNCDRKGYNKTISGV